MTQSNYDKRRFTVAIVALLVALVLLLAIGGYSLAKYVTSGSSNGEAAVAKWGYTVSTDTSNLFGKNYKANVVSTNTDAAQLEVKAADDQNVVAPGTTGSMTFTVNGTAEVASKLNIAVSDVQDVVLTYGDNAYKPVKWTLNDGTTDVVSNGTLEAVAAELNKIQNVEVNPGETVGKNYTLTWAWAFEGGNDEADTALGLLASGKTDVKVGGVAVDADASKLTVKFTLNVSVQQIER